MASELTPLPGDPVALKTKADKLSSSAQQIQQAINQLRKLADRDDTVSQAVDKVRGKAVEVANNITQAHVRYVGTAEALQEYAPKLEAAQQRANRAIQAHGAAQQQVTNAQANLQQQSNQYTQAQAQAQASPGASTQSPQDFGSTPAGAQAHQQVSDANDAVSNAIKEYNEAKAEVETAAQHAISKINSAMDDSGLNDSFWDRLKNTVESWASDAYSWAKKNLAPILDVIQKVAAALNNILSWVSMVVSVLAIFIPVLAPIAAALDLVTLALAAISFLATLALVAFGDRTWGDVLSTGITLVMSALPLKGSGKDVAEAAEGLGKKAEQLGARNSSKFVKLAAKAGKKGSGIVEGVGKKAEALGSTKVIDGMASAYEKVGKNLGEKFADKVGEKGAALGKYLNGGKIAEAATNEGSRAYQFGRNLGFSEGAASGLMRSVAGRTTRTMTEAVEKEWSHNASKVADKVFDLGKDSVKDTVVGNTANTLDHYVFHQTDHNPSGLELEAPSTASALKFVSAEEGFSPKPEVEWGSLDPASGWKYGHASPGAETADLAGGG